MQFDGPVDLSHSKLGKLLGGTLKGPITIDSGATRPDGGDDLHVTARDAVMKDNVITSPYEVDFQFGASQGHGRNMKIELLPGPATGKSRGPNIGGLQSFELTDDVQMHLQSAASGIMPGDRSAEPSPLGRGQGEGASIAPGTLTPTLSQRERGPNRAQPPVDIRCQGPFQFDLVSYIATFHDRVDVISANPFGGRSDQMKCELLSILFAAKEQPKTAGKAAANSSGKSNRAGMPQLEPRGMRAEGNPVIIDAPSRLLEARANSFTYKPGPDGALLGDLDADGPGWIRIARRDDPTQQFEARWSKKLTMLPQDENHVVSLIGDAHSRYADSGELAAEAIHVWLYETPVVERNNQRPPSPGVATPGLALRDGSATTNQPNNALAWIHPVKMFADGEVHLDSPQLSGVVKRLEAWFNPAPATGGPDNVAGRSQTGRNRQSPLERSRIAQSNGKPQDHYEIKRGGLLQATFIGGQQLAGRPQMELASVELKDDVWFIQTPIATESPPLEIIGDHVQADEVNDPTKTVMVVEGRPAQVGRRA